LPLKRKRKTQNSSAPVTTAGAKIKGRDNRKKQNGRRKQQTPGETPGLRTLAAHVVLQRASRVRRRDAVLTDALKN
jgi:hypothetical protein